MSARFANMPTSASALRSRNITRLSRQKDAKSEIIRRKETAKHATGEILSSRECERLERVRAISLQVPYLTAAEREDLLAACKLGLLDPHQNPTARFDALDKNFDLRAALRELRTERQLRSTAASALTLQHQHAGTNAGLCMAPQAPHSTTPRRSRSRSRPRSSSISAAHLPGGESQALGRTPLTTQRRRASGTSKTSTPRARSRRATRSRSASAAVTSKVAPKSPLRLTTSEWRVLVGSGDASTRYANADAVALAVSMSAAGGTPCLPSGAIPVGPGVECLVLLTVLPAEATPAVDFTKRVVSRVVAGAVAAVGGTAVVAIAVPPLNSNASDPTNLFAAALEAIGLNVTGVSVKVNLKSRHGIEEQIAASHPANVPSLDLSSPKASNLHASPAPALHTPPLLEDSTPLPPPCFGAARIASLSPTPMVERSYSLSQDSWYSENTEVSFGTTVTLIAPPGSEGRIVFPAQRKHHKPSVSLVAAEAADLPRVCWMFKLDEVKSFESRRDLADSMVVARATAAHFAGVFNTAVPADHNMPQLAFLPATVGVLKPNLETVASLRGLAVDLAVLEPLLEDPVMIDSNFAGAFLHFTAHRSGGVLAITDVLGTLSALSYSLPGGVYLCSRLTVATGPEVGRLMREHNCGSLCRALSLP